MKIQSALISIMLFTPLAVAKVTYNDAMQSSADFYESNNETSTSPIDTGLTPDETQSEIRSGNQLGHWVKTGSEVMTFGDAGAYASNPIPPSSIGQECLLGAKGWIANEKIGSREVCAHQTSGHCDVWNTERFNYLSRDEGYKAECQ